MARILIVDDAQHTRGVLKTFLEDQGHLIRGEFEDPFNALNFVKENNSIDIIYLDYNLNCFCNNKNYTGIDFLDDLQKIRRGIKVILISAHSEPKIVSEAIFHGASDFIAKPFILTEVKKRLNKMLEKYSA